MCFGVAFIQEQKRMVVGSLGEGGDESLGGS